MKVKEFAEKLDLKLLIDNADLDRDVKGCYIGDLLSWVMSKAKQDDVWITVMGNLNACAVATLCDVSMIILCEGALADEALLNRAKENQLAVFSSYDDAYTLAVKISGLL